MHSFCFENWAASLGLIESVPGRKPEKEGSERLLCHFTIHLATQAETRKHQSLYNIQSINNFHARLHE